MQAFFRKIMDSQKEAVEPLLPTLEKKKARAPGFEPGNGRSKVCCLTTWPRPIINQPAEPPVHRDYNTLPKY